MSALSLQQEPGSSDRIAAFRSDLECRLAEIWADVIGSGPVGNNDDFFAIGGDSLLAADLVTEVGRSLGEPIPLETLLSAPTITRMAAALAVRRGSAGKTAGKSARNPTEPPALVVALRALGSKTPMFLLPGSGGHVLGFYELVRFSDPDRPFFGLQLPDPVPGRKLPSTVEAMASRFLPEILAVEPTGPYLLGGYSFGGLVAFELARQLTAAGREVGLVAMIDAWGQGYPRQLFALLRAWDHLRAIASLPAGSRLAYVRERLARKYRRKHERSGVAISQPFENINHRVREIYQPEPYSGQIVIFRAAERPILPGVRFDDPALGWGPLALGGIQIRTVPGDHITLLHPPHVSTLAESLCEVLDEQAADRSIHNDH